MMNLAGELCHIYTKGLKDFILAVPESGLSVNDLPKVPHGTITWMKNSGIIKKVGRTHEQSSRIIWGRGVHWEQVVRYLGD